jgi:hypothetical protein
MACIRYSTVDRLDPRINVSRVLPASSQYATKHRKLSLRWPNQLQRLSYRPSILHTQHTYTHSACIPLQYKMARRRIGNNELKQLLLVKCKNPSPSGQCDVSPFLFIKEMLIRLFMEVSHQCHTERSRTAENTPTVCSVSTGKLQHVG